MLPEKLYDVLNYDGAVSMTSWSDDIVHVTCTWNSYIQIKEANLLLIPSVGMKATEEDLDRNSQLILTIGTREIEGLRGFPGTAYRVHGHGEFLDEGDYFEETKKKYSFITRVLVVEVDSVEQIL